MTENIHRTCHQRHLFGAVSGTVIGSTKDTVIGTTISISKGAIIDVPIYWRSRLNNGLCMHQWHRRIMMSGGAHNLTPEFTGVCVLANICMGTCGLAIVFVGMGYLPFSPSALVASPSRSWACSALPLSLYVLQPTVALINLTKALPVPSILCTLCQHNIKYL